MSLPPTSITTTDEGGTTSDGEQRRENDSDGRNTEVGFLMFSTQKIVVYSSVSCVCYLLFVFGGKI